MAADYGKYASSSLPCVIALAVGTAGVAHAETTFSNPFATAEMMRVERATLPDASMRLRYQYDSTAPFAASEEVTIDAAADWALVRNGNALQLFDYRLGRLVALDPGQRKFTSLNLVHRVWFLVAERQNRMVLSRALEAASGESKSADACDTEAELGISIPALKDEATTILIDSGEATVVECNGRVVGRFEAGEDPLPPAAFWPTMALTMPTPPLLREAIQNSGRAPRWIEVSFRLAGSGQVTRTWRLVVREESAEPYPLLADYANATASMLDDAVAAGLGELALAAVEGSTDGGPPTVEAWDARLRSTADHEGIASATLAISPTASMFPVMLSECNGGGQWFVCGLLNGIRDIYSSDAAVRAFFDIATAEQSGDSRAALDAMERARTSDQFDNPVLGAAFALALLKGGAPMQEQAKARGLPFDPWPLQRAAVEAYPYSPSYWTDLGDSFVREFRMAEAFLLYEVSFFLPIDGARNGNPVLDSKRALVNRLRADFPYYFME